MLLKFLWIYFCFPQGEDNYLSIVWYCISQQQPQTQQSTTGQWTTTSYGSTPKDGEFEYIVFLIIVE